jgi:hypothetical protein
VGADATYSAVLARYLDLWDLTPDGAPIVTRVAGAAATLHINKETPHSAAKLLPVSGVGAKRRITEASRC